MIRVRISRLPNMDSGGLKTGDKDWYEIQQEKKGKWVNIGNAANNGTQFYMTLEHTFKLTDKEMQKRLTYDRGDGVWEYWEIKDK